MPKFHFPVSAALCAVASAAIIQPAVAQGASGATAPQPASANDQNSDDIIVTATRRSEALSDIPLAVSAVTAQSLQNSGASDLRQLNQLSPSLLVSSTSSEAGAGGARIRGIGTVGDNPGLESSVATFIDGVYRNRAGVGLTELGAIDRIEVLRGPQGTLFGRNASAGLISVITAKPSFTFGAEGEASYGNYNAYRFQGGVTGPISETIALRLDGTYSKRDGFLHDVISGRDVNNRDRYLIRGQVLLQPNPDLSVRIIGDYSNRKEECCGATYLPAYNVTPGTSGPGSFTKSPSTIATIERALGGIINDNTFSRDIAITPGQGFRGDVRDYGVSGEINYTAGDFNLTSITSYRDWRWLRGQDADYNNLDILHRAGDGTANQSFKTFTQELRLQGKAFNDKLDFLVGGYFANEILNFRDNISYGSDYQRFANCLTAANFASQTGVASLLSPAGTGCFNTPVATAVGNALAANQATAPTAAVLRLLSGQAIPGLGGYGAASAFLGLGPGGLNGIGSDDRFHQRSRNFAVFTHNVFNITDRLAVTIGARYTSERKTLDATLTDNNTLCRAVSASSLAALQLVPCVIPSVPGGSYTQNGERKSENKFTGTAVISFKPVEELLTYASFSRGYKAGGFNLDRASLFRLGRTAGANGTGAVDGTVLNLNQLEFKPETVDAFEVGAKYNGRGFDLNIAGFYQRFNNFQLNTFNGVNFVVENVQGCTTLSGGDNSDSDLISGNSGCTGKSKSGVTSKGVEIEAFIRPARNVAVNLGVTIADTRYANNLVGTPSLINTSGSLLPSLSQLPGARLSNSAMYVTTGSFTWTPALGGSGLTGLLYADFRYSSDLNTGSDLDFEKRQDGVAIVNARIGIRGAEARWGLDFWAQNVFNTNYTQVSFDSPVQGSGSTNSVRQGQSTSSTGLYSTFLAEPRTYGVTARFKF
jgi:iron complex outermembrane receptor protein